jgi:hypothetical protein
MKILNIFLLVILTSAHTATSANNSDGNSSEVATIVFMRSSFVGSMIKSSIYEVTPDGTIFIGILKNKKRIEYQTSPGKHTFMVVSEAADFMEAEVVANKTYHSIIVARSGAWKARFSMIPIRNDGTTKFNTDSPDFAKWLKKTKVATMTDKDKAWYEKHKDSVEAKRAKYWEVFKKKSPEALAERTLNANDGVDRD